MSKKDDGGSAFPIEGGQGMSLRDYFAAAALPAVIAAYIEANGRCIGTEHIKANCAAHAFFFADAMLAERSQ